MSAIRKSDLQRIIREEYARVLLERSGHRVTESRVRLIAEKIEDGDLDEGMLGALGGLFGRGAKAAGGAVKGAVTGAAEKVGGAVKAGAQKVGAAYKEELKKSNKNDIVSAVEKITAMLKDEVFKGDAGASMAIAQLGALKNAIDKIGTSKAAPPASSPSADEKAAAE